MNWFERLEIMLARSRQTGRPIEVFSGGQWLPVSGAAAFYPATEYRLGALTTCRPMTPAELAGHIGEPVLPLDQCTEGVGKPYFITNVDANGATVATSTQDADGQCTRSPTFQELAAEWVFMRDGKADKTLPPVGIVTSVPPINLPTEPLTAPIQALSVRFPRHDQFGLAVDVRVKIDGYWRRVAARSLLHGGREFPVDEILDSPVCDDTAEDGARFVGNSLTDASLRLLADPRVAAELIDMANRLSGSKNG